MKSVLLGISDKISTGTLLCGVKCFLYTACGLSLAAEALTILKNLVTLWGFREGQFPPPNDFIYMGPQIKATTYTIENPH